MRLEERRIWVVDRSDGRTSQPIGMSVKLSDAKDSMMREPAASDQPATPEHNRLLISRERGAIQRAVGLVS